MEIDPVCGMEVATQDAAWTAEYAGTKYYFCSPGCNADFENNPEKYLKAEAE